MLQVLASERYNAHLVPEDGCLTCPEPGVCESLCSLHFSGQRSARLPTYPSGVLTLSPYSRRRAVFRQQLQHAAVQEGELQSGGSAPSGGAAADSPQPRGAEAAVINSISTDNQADL